MEIKDDRLKLLKEQAFQGLQKYEQGMETLYDFVHLFHEIPWEKRFYNKPLGGSVEVVPFVEILEGFRITRGLIDKFIKDCSRDVILKKFVFALFEAMSLDDNQLLWDSDKTLDFLQSIATLDDLDVIIKLGKQKNGSDV